MVHGVAPAPCQPYQQAMPQPDNPKRDDIPSPNAKQRAAEERCAALVRHARDLICSEGVDRFSVSAVLRQAGGSKATIAKYFGDRTGLIAAAIAAEARDAIAAFAVPESAGHDLPLPVLLETVLGAILRFYCAPGSIALYRAVISAADPAGAAAFYRHGHEAIVTALAALLDGRKGRGVALSCNARDVADQLVHAIRAGCYERLLIGLDPQADDAACAQRVRQTVALVLPGIAQAA